ncbi:MAG: hypothetical protein WCT41_02900 [Candidatus Paceibacterota bacterium]|jgi:hypothetical protein
MTIIVKRKRREPKFEKEMGEVAAAARRMSIRKLISIQEVLVKKRKADDKLKAAAIRRYADKHNLHLYCHRHPWIADLYSGEKIRLPPGFYAKVNGVIENIIAE